MRQISIKWKLFGYLAIFVVIIISILWIFQVAFLDNFYRLIKTNNVKSIIQTIDKNINHDKLSGLVENLSEKHECNIGIYDENTNMLLYYEAKKLKYPQKMDDLFKCTTENGGMYMARSHSNNRGMGKALNDSITLVKKSNDRYIVVSSPIVPVSSTVSTLKVQLLIITFLLIAVSFLMALYISRNISKPIVQINESAKKLSQGQYSAEFNANQYKEISELSDTLNYASCELSKVDNLRKELLANISHDLRTPLTMIIGYSEAMRDLPNENTPENLQIVIDEAKRLSTLVCDVLDISKLQSGNIDLNLKTFDLTNSIIEIVNRYKKLTDNIYEFIFDEHVEVYADETRIMQVVYNLLNNAVTYTGDDKKITIKQTVTSDSVKIEVIDTGEGIKEEYLPYIWDRYYKVSQNHKRAAIGTGLGLSIVKSIIDMHGGKCGVKSGKNGSTFYFSIKRI